MKNRESLSKLERGINRKLKQVHPDYALSNLAQAADGRYVFDLTVAIDPRHFSQVRGVLKQVLRELPIERPVQAKFYLPRSLYARVKKKAATVGVSQSALVARCLSRHL